MLPVSSTVSSKCYLVSFGVTCVINCVIQVLPVSHMVGNIEEAYQLIKDLEPSSPQEYILKAVANAFIGQEQGSVSPYIVLVTSHCLSHPLQPENVKLAQQYYQLVGSSGSECGENITEERPPHPTSSTPHSTHHRHYPRKTGYGLLLLPTQAV